MYDFMLSIWSTNGLLWITLAALIAGIVRGFSGFGTAMIFLPAASSFLSPVEALLCMMAMDVIGPIPNLPRAIRDAKKSELWKLVLGMALVLPLASFILTAMSGEVFRYLVSCVALVLLVLLILGVRYRGAFKDWMLYGTGALGGFLGGVSGVPGPPVIMIYMASDNPPSVIRANNTLYLFCFDILIFIVFWLRGLLSLVPLALGLLMAIPYTLGTIIGQRIFDPEKEKQYRMAAYVIIGISALRGLPIWGL